MRKKERERKVDKNERIRIRVRGIEYFFSDEKELDEYLKEKVSKKEFDKDWSNLVKMKIRAHNRRRVLREMKS